MRMMPGATVSVAGSGDWSVWPLYDTRPAAPSIRANPSGLSWIDPAVPSNVMSSFDADRIVSERKQ